MQTIFTIDSGNNFLHAYGSEHDFRVVALANIFTTAQKWTVTDRGNGRFTIHRVVDGIKRYLTAEANGGTHVFTFPKNPGFNGQTWRTDQFNTNNFISLGKSGRFLQADVAGLIVIQPDGSPVNSDAPRGFNVELVRKENIGTGSAWTPLVP
jgi:hypothetical protein